MSSICGCGDLLLTRVSLCRQMRDSLMPLALLTVNTYIKQHNAILRLHFPSLVFDGRKTFRVKAKVITHCFLEAVDCVFGRKPPNESSVEIELALQTGHCLTIHVTCRNANGNLGNVFSSHFQSKDCQTIVAFCAKPFTKF